MERRRTLYHGNGPSVTTVISYGYLLTVYLPSPRYISKEVSFGRDFGLQFLKIEI